jgi:hypothetical protein
MGSIGLPLFGLARWHYISGGFGGNKGWLAVWLIVSLVCLRLVEIVTSEVIVCLSSSFVSY